MDGGKKTSDLASLTRFVGAVRLRMILYLRARAACRAALAAAVPAFLILFAARFTWLPGAPAAAFAFLAAAIAAALLFTRTPLLLHAAMLVDRKLGLGELLTTAIETDDSSSSSMLLHAQAARKIATAKPSAVASFRVPPEAPALLAVSLALAVFCGLTDPALRMRPEAEIEAENRARKARELDLLAGRIEKRFGDVSAPVASELREMARRLENPAEPYTATKSAMAEAALAWESEAASLEDAERALANAVAAAGTAGGAGGDFEIPQSAVQKEAARAALSEILSDPSASPAHGPAARGAIEALDTGAAPGFSRNMALLMADLDRTRRARMALEAARRKAEEAADSVTTAPGLAAADSSRGRDSGTGTQSKSSGQSGSGDGSGGRVLQAQLGGEQPWNPVYDDVVKRYFGSGGR